MQHSDTTGKQVVTRNIWSSPLQFNVVNLLKIDSAYQAEIESSSYLAYSYKDVMILGGKYSYIYNNQKINKSKDYWFLRVNAEASGNLLALIKRYFKRSEDRGWHI